MCPRNQSMQELLETSSCKEKETVKNGGKLSRRPEITTLHRQDFKKVCFCTQASLHAAKRLKDH